MPIPPIAIGALGNFFNFLKGFLSGSPRICLAFVEQNNRLQQELKKGGNNANLWIMEVHARLFNAFCIQGGPPVCSTFTSEMWNVFMRKFTAGGGSWNLAIPGTFKEALEEQFKIIDKYKGIFDPSAYATYLADLGGSTYFLLAKGSGKATVKHWESLYKSIDKLIALLPEKQGGGPPQGQDENPLNLREQWIAQQINPFYKKYLGREMNPEENNNWKNTLKQPYPMTQADLNNYLNSIINSAEAKAYAQKNQGQGQQGGGGGGTKQAGFGILPILLIAGVALGMKGKS